jgi:hypothetical protein
MQLDIRIPIGLLFSILGVVIGGYGLVTMGSDIYVKSLGRNLNLWTGLGLLAFGLVMLLPALKAQKRKAAAAAAAAAKPQEAPRP